MIDQRNCALKTVPAAAELRNVPNFNPLRYLRKEVSRKTGEKVLKLDLTYKKMWFRLAFPHGRMTLTPLRITDQMALFKASIYSSMDDSHLLSEFTSSMERREAGSQYVQAAQDEALNQALDNAGFGIQLSDLVEHTGGSGCGSEVLLSEVESLLKRTEVAAQPDAPVVTRTAQTAAEMPVSTVIPAPTRDDCPLAGSDSHAANEVMADGPSHASSETPVQAEPVTAEEPVPQTDPSMSQSVPEPSESPETKVVSPAQIASTPEAADTLPTETAEKTPMETESILQLLGAIPTAEPKAPSAASQASAIVDFPLPAESQQEQGNEQVVEEGRAAEIAFTEDMTVDEIRKLMTVEQAKAQMVTFGTNKGWNLGQVLDRRPSSLRFYALVAKEASNALKAASFLLMEELNQAKAG